MSLFVCLLLELHLQLTGNIQIYNTQDSFTSKYVADIVTGKIYTFYYRIQYSNPRTMQTMGNVWRNDLGTIVSINMWTIIHYIHPALCISLYMCFMKEREKRQRKSRRERERKGRERQEGESLLHASIS